MVSDGEKSHGDADRSAQVELTLPVGDRQEAWTRLAEAVRAFTSAWNQNGESPALVEFLPAAPAGLRLLALNELIKADLRQRWRRGQGKLIEEYLAEFHELASGGELPCDVIVEEYQVRQQTGEDVDVEKFVNRFPTQAESLRRLIGLTPPTVTTALVSERRPDELQAGQRIDDFDLLARLGEGAFASVFLARQISMQRLVALKVSADRGQEPQTLAQMDHPHIVRVYDQRSAPDRGLRLLYMQYVSGGTLLDVVRRVGQTPPARRNGALLLEAIDAALSKRGDAPPTESSLRRFLAEATWPEAVCWLGARLAEALDYAHQRGVLHRDIKPANVLLAADGGPKLADFNVSYCSKVEGATAAAYMGGSLAYMSPEQLEACDPGNSRAIDDLDGRSDLFSLGVMLWELLTGRRPFADIPMTQAWNETLRNYARQRRGGVPEENWRQLPADCPPLLLDALRSCLASQRDDRPATAAQVARQLQLCLQPRVQSLLKPRGQTWLSWLRNHPLAAVCLAGLVPNLICSALNISYNFREIISRLETVDAQGVFYRQLAIINPIAFGLGIVMALRYAWPLFGPLTAPNNITLDESYELQRRALHVGDVVAWVSGLEWIVSGIVFPLWLHLEVGHLSQLGWQDHLHFFMSQVLCGLLAAPQVFFLVSTLAVHGFFPALVRPDQENAAPVEWLGGLLRRAKSMFYVAMSVPFLAIGAVGLANLKDSTPFGVLAAVGFASFVAAYRLFGVIQTDVETLVVAVSPGSESGVTTTTGSLSFRRTR